MIKKVIVMPIIVIVFIGGLLISCSKYEINSEPGYYHLKPSEEKVIRIEGNRANLDASIFLHVNSKTENGAVKLSYGGNWYDVGNDIHYNIDTEQIEKWEYDKEREEMDIIVLPVSENYLEVDNKGITIKTSADYIFNFNSKDDFLITIENLSNKELALQIQVEYR